MRLLQWKLALLANEVVQRKEVKLAVDFVLVVKEILSLKRLFALLHQKVSLFSNQQRSKEMGLHDNQGSQRGTTCRRTPVHSPQ